MKTKLVFAAIAAIVCINSYGQKDNIGTIWEMFVGEWLGEGSGQPGEGDGICSFAQELDGKAVVRRSHSEYAVAGSTTKVIHEDLLFIYNADSNEPKAIYIDNEGHTINYSITIQGKTAMFTSEIREGTPTFRLVHTLLEDGKLLTAFEMSQDGISFTPYVEGVSRRAK